MNVVFPLLVALFCCSAFCSAQTIRTISIDELETWIQKNDDTVRVFNFWATWCKPCIEEMPAFDSLQREYTGNKVQVVFVSLDFPSQLEKRVRPFVTKRKFAAPVVLLNAANPNAWIDRISPEWSGAIPATLLVRSSHKVLRFYEREFTFDEIHSLVTSLLEDK